MKSFIVAFLMTILCINSLFANKVDIVIINKTNEIVQGYQFIDRSSSSFFCDRPPAPAYQNMRVNAQSQLVFPGPDFGCGAAGKLVLKIFNGKDYFAFVEYENPVLGKNEFRSNADYPYIIRYVSGGSGDKCTVTFEISGGPLPIPPPPPVPVETNGNRVVEGSFSWNPEVEGMPEVENISNVGEIFELKATAPRYLIRNVNGTGPQQYKNYNGYFTGALDVGIVSFRVEQRLNKIECIYRISGLPDNVPIMLLAKPVADWKPGSLSTQKPPAAKVAFVAVLNEVFVSHQRVDYQVYGVWLADIVNGKTGVVLTDLQSFLAGLKNSNPSPWTSERLSSKQSAFKRQAGPEKIQLGTNTSSTSQNNNVPATNVPTPNLPRVINVMKKSNNP